MRLLLAPLPDREIKSGDGLCILLLWSDKALLREAIEVAEREQMARQQQGRESETWRRVCGRRSSHPYHYAERWTFPVFYFREPLVALIQGTDGLDVGARVPDPGSRDRSLPCPPGGKRNSSELRETYVPHFAYYKAIGCRMHAIDLFRDESQPEVEVGDARLLPYEPESFDFITAPMLLGPSNPCASPLEIVLCLSEFKRVLRPGGLTYLADAGVQPSVIYAAQCLGFRIGCLKGKAPGQPIGTLLVKPGVHQWAGLLDQTLCNADLPVFSDEEDEILHSANLFWDAGATRVMKATPQSAAAGADFRAVDCARGAV